MAEVEIRADQQSFNRVARAVESEAGGRRLRADLVDELEDAVDPGVTEVRAAVMGMQTGGLPHGGEPLRPAVAAAIDDEIALSGSSLGVRVVARTTGMPRGFRLAAKRLNATRWRHPVFGGRVVVTQIGAPGFFDDTLARRAPAARRGVVRAMQKSIDRMSRKA